MGGKRWYSALAPFAVQRDVTVSNDAIRRGPPLSLRFGTQPIGNWLRETARARPRERQIFWSDSTLTEITLAELDRAGEQLAAAFHALGVSSGDVIAVQMPNRLETSIAYRACFRLEATLLPIVHIFGPAELTFLLRQSRAKVLVVPDSWRNIDFIERVGKLGECPDLQHVVVVGDRALAGALRWDDLMTRSHPQAPPLVLGAEAPCLLLFTSGTTADPKGVQHSSATLLAELDQRLANGDSSVDTTFSAWPTGHIGGLASLLFPQIVGSRSVFMDRWEPTAGVQLMAQHRVSRTAGVPLFLIELLDAANAVGADLSSLRSYMVGAASVPASLVQRAEEAGVAVFRAYGSTEHPTISSSRPEAPLEQRAFSDGTILPGVEVRLIDEAGNDVAGHSEGEIISRGRELFAGYLDPALNAEAFTADGWFRTGDIGRLEGQRLTITDRKKDIIIRGGENISSKEVEDVLSSHSAVREASAIPVPHPRLGETVCVIAMLQPGASLSLEDVQRHFAKAGVARQKTPERLELVADFPRTPSGKIKKHELKQGFQ